MKRSTENSYPGAQLAMAGRHLLDMWFHVGL
jgi:hypothetical protein